MKRDLELIRKLVLAAESSPSGYVKKDVDIEGYSREQIGYHSYLLVDAGLAKGVDITTFGSSSPNWRLLHPRLLAMILQTLLAMRALGERPQV